MLGSRSGTDELSGIGRFRAVSDLLHPLAGPFQHETDREDVVVLIHGWTGSPAHMRMLGDALTEAGFGVIAPLLAGHGTKIADMTATTWRDWVRTAAEAAHAAGSENRRVHVVGLSMGGVIGLLLAPALSLASVTTINAPQIVHSRLPLVAGLFRHIPLVVPRRPPAPPPGDGAAYFHQYNDDPVGTVADLFDLVTAARRSLGQVKCPALVIQSKTDETVDPMSAEIIREGLGSSQKRVVWLERSRHAATLDEERETIHREIIHHLRAVADSAADAPQDASPYDAATTTTEVDSG